MTEHGFTLVETIVVLAVLALLYGITAAALPVVEIDTSPENRLSEASRITVLHTGWAGLINLPGDSLDRVALVLPDGRIIAPRDGDQP